MTKGLKIRHAGVVTFDSSIAAGGVCLGVFTIAAGGAVIGFPAFATAQGIALSAGQGRAASLVTVNHDLGYLRFIFPAAAAGSAVTLFAK